MVRRSYSLLLPNTAPHQPSGLWLSECSLDQGRGPVPTPPSYQPAWAPSDLFLVLITGFAAEVTNCPSLPGWLEGKEESVAPPHPQHRMSMITQRQLSSSAVLPGVRLEAGPGLQCQPQQTRHTVSAAAE